MSRAAMAKMRLFIKRLPNVKRSCRLEVFSGLATPMQTVPTGLSGEPPLGPAIPLVASFTVSWMSWHHKSAGLLNIIW